MRPQANSGDDEADESGGVLEEDRSKVGSDVAITSAITSRPNSSAGGLA